MTMCSLEEISSLSETVLDGIADSIAEEGYVLVENFLSYKLAQALLNEAKQRSTVDFQSAGIGRDAKNQRNSQVRRDATLWLSGDSSVQSSYLEIMQQLKLALNRRLFMGLSEFECHYSHYRKGDFYLRHLDAFKENTSGPKNNRRLSTVFYLNPSWRPEDGGELTLYADQNSPPLLNVSPVFNQCVIFLSATFPHEVQVSHNDRYSIAGWFR